MSSGEILSAPEAVSAAAAAVLAVRAVSAAAEATARAVDQFRADAENSAATRSEARVRESVWDAVAAEVVEVNARIRMLAERAARAGVAVAPLRPLSLTGLTAAEAAQWSARTARRLFHVQTTIRAAVAVDEVRRVVAQLPHSVTARPNLAAALEEFQGALLKRYANNTIATAGLSVRYPDVEAILLTLDLDAHEREHADVLSAAACVVRDDPREALAYLHALQTKVKVVNEAVTRRRLAAQWLSALEEPVVAAVEPPGPFLGTAARLRAVVAGDEDLTAQLRAHGAEAVEWAAEVTRRCFVRDVMTSRLAGLGYRVEGEFGLDQSVELRLTRADWHGEHSAELWVDRYGALHGRVVREKRLQGDRAADDEPARRAGFNADIRTLGRHLHADVVIEDDYIPRNRTSERMGD